MPSSPANALSRVMDMAAYRIYFIGLDGHFTRVETLDCPDDSSALGHAARLAGGYEVEVWQQERQIATLRRDAEAGRGSRTRKQDAEAGRGSRTRKQDAEAGR
jgi:hypothetical protein